VLLFNLVEADSGSVGPFLGLSLLGVNIEIAHRTWLEIDAGELDAAIPKMRGVPFVFRQHRATIGLRWNP
jgi:hypothetical protein